MGSVKIVLRKKMNRDGSFPIAIRITKDRKSSFIYVGQNIKDKDWDSILQRVKKSHPNSQRLNNLLLKKVAETNDKLLELEVDKGSVSSAIVKQQLKPIKGTSFFSQADLYLENFKTAGKFNRLGPEQSRVKKFREFLKGDDILFHDITVSLINKYKAYLKGKENASERSVVNHLILIRTIFNQAIEENIVDKKHYPFGKNKISIKIPNSLKIGLNPDEVQRIEDLLLEKGSQVNHARNVWLFSFYFAGMRVSDVLRLRWSDFKDDRLHYTMSKNSKGGSLKIADKAAKILSEYKPQKRSEDDLIFPDLKKLKDLNDNFIVQKKISHADKTLNEHLAELARLAKIDKKLTMHIARHTFGNISGDKIPIQMLQKLYRHSSVLTTIGYQSNFIHKDVDQALESVIKL